MKYHQLNTSSQSRKKRVGRGISSGSGKTAGRGTKGQKSRSGGSIRPGFEGGQNPLMQRLPKLKGFTNYKAKTVSVTTRQLNKVNGKKIDNLTLKEAGIVVSEYDNVKLVLKGKPTKEYNVQLQGISKSAQSAIEQAGGSFKKVDRLKSPVKASKETKETKK